MRRTGWKRTVSFGRVHECRAGVAFARGERGAHGFENRSTLPAHFGSFDDAGGISSYGGSKARIVPQTPPESCLAARFT